MDFLDIEGKTFLVFGVANKKSVAFFVSQILSEAGANVIHSVQSAAHKESISKLFPDADIYICDVEQDNEIAKLAETVSKIYPKIHGIVHSIAFANYEAGLKPFHETRKKDFLQSVEISCFSLISIANAFKDLLDEKASVVTISISATTIAAEPYGWMAPVKAALDSTLCFLAKSFSSFSQVRFNSVKAGLLKTSSSAGIPGYLDYYLFAEQLSLRKKSIETKEVANAVAFLLSDRSSGINAQGIVVDCGMSTNYFDKGLMATIGRNRAIVESRGLRMTGFLAWLTWLFIHIAFLVGFRNRVAVLSQWIWAYVTNRRASRVVFSHPKEQGATVLEPRVSQRPSAAEQATSEIGVPNARPSGSWAWSRSDD